MTEPTSPVARKPTKYFPLVSRQQSTSSSSSSRASADGRVPTPVPAEVARDAPWSRDAFVLQLLDPQRMAQFKDFVNEKERKKPVTRSMFLFLDGFWKLQEVFDDLKKNPGAATNGPSPMPAAPPPAHPVVREFASARSTGRRRGSGAVAADSLADMVVVPAWLATQLLRFYATFVVPGAPEDIKGLSMRSRESTAESLLDLGGDRHIATTAFNAVAVEVLELLYTGWFPVYLSAFGITVPEAVFVRMPADTDSAQYDQDGEDATSQRHSSTDSRDNTSRLSAPSAANASQPSTVNETSTVARSASSGSSFNLSQQSALQFPQAQGGGSKGNKLAGLFSKLVIKKAPKEEAPVPLTFTRESLVRLFHHPVQYRDFAQFVQSTHCGENLMFYEAFLKLESRLLSTREGNGPNAVAQHDFAPCLDRFLKLGTSISQTYEETPTQPHTVPVILVPLILLFHAMFIAPGSTNEVNLTHSMRKAIVSELARGRGLQIPVTIFDGAIDHVLALLYDNSFKLYLRQRGEEV
nr:hypothetical protein HK105_002977 [Polyrhizophydium stewartii]